MQKRYQASVYLTEKDWELLQAARAAGKTTSEILRDGLQLFKLGKKNKPPDAGEDK